MELKKCKMSDLEGNREPRPSTLDDDLRRIGRWVKEDLFRGCKFIYRGKEDLEVSGNFYNIFKTQCGPKLKGVRAAASDLMQRVYLEKVWEEATKRNTVNNGLALRRSGVYTVMQNRFMGKNYQDEGCFIFKKLN
jgi:hypothetical protein